MIERYNHHGNDVCVRRDLKGRHREHCLCYDCDEFSGEDRVSNCPISNVVYAICVAFGIVSPIWECPKFKEIGGE